MSASIPGREPVVLWYERADGTQGATDMFDPADARRLAVDTEFAKREPPIVAWGTLPLSDLKRAIRERAKKGADA